MKTTFSPTLAQRVIHHQISHNVADRGMDRFFELWEAGGDFGDPREAGSLVANAFMEMAARIAVFGADCSGHEPDLSLWMAMCEKHFHNAVEAVKMATLEAEVFKRVQAEGSAPP